MYSNIYLRIYLFIPVYIHAFIYLYLRDFKSSIALKTESYELSSDVVGGAYAAERARSFYWWATLAGSYGEVR